LEAKALAGLKGYITNRADPTPEFVIGAYHRLWHIEKSLCATRRPVVSPMQSGGTGGRFLGLMAYSAPKG
jgi:hypothetical protein